MGAETERKRGQNGKGVRTILAQYTYLGQRKIVVEDYESADVELIEFRRVPGEFQIP